MKAMPGPELEPEPERTGEEVRELKNLAVEGHFFTRHYAPPDPRRGSRARRHDLPLRKPLGGGL